MLRPQTEKLWNRLRAEPLLAGFVLVGGTALTLRVSHRLSEDLDFAFADGARLPRQRLNALQLALEAEGTPLARNDDAAAADEFEIAGMELHDHQQDFVASGAVKLTFFCPEPEVLRVLQKNPDEGRGPRVAELAELFALKSLLTASRSRLRDWIDLWTLLEHHGFTMKQFHDVFDRAGVPTAREIALRRLASGTTPMHDPGYEALAEADLTLPSRAALREYFAKAVQKMETEAASRAWHPPTRPEAAAHRRLPSA